MHIRSIASCATGLLPSATILATGLATGLALGMALHAQVPGGSAAPVPAKVQVRLDALGAEAAASRSTGDQAATAKALNQLGALTFDLAQFTRSHDFYSDALLAARAVGDSRQVAAALNGLANCSRDQGQSDLAFATYTQALEIATNSGDALNQAEALNGMGWVDSNRGQLETSLEFHTRALPLARAANDDVLEASILRRIGNVYYASGDKQKALEYQQQALPLSIRAGDRRGEGRSLGNIGVIYADLGEWQLALEYSNRALPILQEEGDRSAEATDLNNIGMDYVDLGDPVTAVRYFARALPIRRQIGDPSGEALELSNAALAFANAGDAKHAEEYDRQAIAIMHRLQERRSEAIATGNLAMAEFQRGDLPAAIEQLKQSLALIRQVGDRSGEALTLTNLGAAYDSTGDGPQALTYYKQALPLAAAVKDPFREAYVFHRLMLNQQTARPTLAIFYGKQAVNLLQQMRGNIRGLETSLQKSFLDSTADSYHDLADLLIGQGRLPEAQRVLDLLKQQEYREYVRGKTEDTLSPLALTPAETRAEAEYAQATAQAVAAGEQWDALNKVAARTPEQEATFQVLSGQLDGAAKGLEQYYARMYVLLGEGSTANDRVRDVKAGVSALGQEIAGMPHTVALYTLVGKERTSILVITGATEVARQVTIREADLNQKVAAFQQDLRDRSKDPRQSAQALYKVLIEPVKADLDQAHATTLVWSLDGVLRYIPLAALFDGKQYLVEKYNTVVITPASIPHLAEKPDVSQLRAVAMGISRKYEDGLPALPAVAGELSEIVTDTQVKGASGALPGTILLDGQFTKKAMEDELHGRFQVVHIASHFVFKPGDDSQSYLLLAGTGESGGGFHLTVADFNSDRNLNLRQTDLLTLSACETGMSGTTSNGREIDGLGTTAQLKGAKSVLSSLWEVDDASTGELMGDFYKRWSAGKGSVTKVAALREAQLDLLLGRTRAATGNTGRGISVDHTAHADAAGLSHPFYWAPFVLMGNWQ